MVDYTIAAQTPQASQAVNPMQSMAQYQNLANAMLQNQQAQRQMQQQNALTDILSRSGGTASPQVLKDLIASGNYEPALALQRHAASMGAIGTQTALHNLQLKEQQLSYTEKQRQLAADAAARDYIAQNDDLTNPDALKKLRSGNPDAYQKIASFNTALAKAKYDEATSGRLTDKANLDLFRTTAETFAGPLRVADEKSFYPIYDQLAKLSKPFAEAIPREFSPANVANMLKIADDLKHTKFQTIGGVPGLIDERTNTFTPTQLGGAGAATPAPGQRADIAPPVAPVAPVAGAPASPMAPTVANALAQGLPGAAPAAPAANALLPQPAAPQTMTQLLAAEKAGELDKLRQQETIKAEVAANRPPAAMTAQQEAKMRGTISDDRATALSTITTMDDLGKAIADVKNLTPSQKKSITGLQSYLYPMGEAKTAETKLANLKGKVTAMGKAAASMSGALGNMAVQEWKIVQDQIASLDTSRMNTKDLDDQLEIIAAQAQGAANRIRDKYEREYQEMFDRYPGRFNLPSAKTGAGANAPNASSSDIDALLKKYAK